MITTSNKDCQITARFTLRQSDARLIRRMLNAWGFLRARKQVLSNFRDRLYFQLSVFMGLPTKSPSSFNLNNSNAMRKKCVINSRDIQLITGMSIRYANNVICKMKEYFKKQKHQFITIEEFCTFTGIPVDRVMGYM